MQNRNPNSNSPSSTGGLDDYKQLAKQKYQQYENEQQERKQKETLEEFKSFFKEVEQYDCDLEKFKKDFYDIFNNGYIEQIEKFKEQLKQLHDKADFFAEKGILQKESYQSAWGKCQNYLDSLLNDQYLLTKALHKQYVIPLVDTFWNVKFQFYLLHHQLEFGSLNSNKKKSLQNNANNQESRKQFKDLTDDLVLKIFSRLSYDDLKALVIVDKQFAKLATVLHPEIKKLNLSNNDGSMIPRRKTFFPNLSKTISAADKGPVRNGKL